MARTEIERSVRQSVLDRLIDTEPGLAADPPPTLAASVRQLKVNLRRDLEWLLNTRRPPLAIPEDFEETRRSILTYGLPDITSMSRDSMATRNALLREVEEAIAHFEPRLADVRVQLVETEGPNAVRELRFVVEALLKMDPNPEQVVFDTVLELASGDYSVKGVGGA
jgi:type VI secretion system protein ImpF